MAWSGASVAERSGPGLEAEHPAQDTHGSGVISRGAEVQQLVRAPDRGHYLTGNAAIHSGFGPHVVHQPAGELVIARCGLAQRLARKHRLPGSPLGEEQAQSLDPFADAAGPTYIGPSAVE
jgi:hypothetical protein